MSLRILSVVTLVTPTGEYGGPVRVAVNQANALNALGHNVTIAGSARGYGGRLPGTVGGVQAVLFPGRTLVPNIGFAGLSAPGLWRWMWKHAGNYDVAHVHVARDLVTLPAASIAHARRVPYVLQPHGMIDPSENPLARPLDALLTRRVLRRARHVLYLTEAENGGLTEVAGAGLDLVHLPNGVPYSSVVVAAAARPTVLYLARLNRRKRPMVFMEAAARVAVHHPGTRFLLVGPDEGEGGAVRQAADRASRSGVDVAWIGALAPEETLGHMLEASVYVLPSVDEPYPMSALEAMSVGLPVVITDTCGLAELVRTSDAGLVVDDSVAALVGAVEQLLADPQEAQRMGQRGRAYVGEHLSMASIAARLERVYLA